MRGELSCRVLQLITRYRRIGKARNVVLERLGLVRRRADAHVARAYAPFRSARRLGHALNKGQRRLLFFGLRLLEDVEIATARGRAAALLGGQHGHAEIELGVLLHRRQITCAVPHDRGLLLEEIAAQRSPLNGAGRHHVVLGPEVAPEPQRFDHGTIVEVSRVARIVHQHLTVLHRQGAEHPVGIAGGGNLDTPARHIAGGIFLDQLLGRGDELIPVRGRIIRVQASFAEGVLVVVHHDGRALKRNAPGLPAGAPVFHQRRVEAVEPRLLFGRRHQVVEGLDGILVDQLEDVDGKHHRKLRRLTAAKRRQRFDAGIVVVSRINRLDLDP